MIKSNIIHNEEEWKEFAKREEEDYLPCDGFDKPNSYPCICCFHTHEDSQCYTWFHHEYVYPSDFNE